jgi:hypothetical protein
MAPKTIDMTAKAATVVTRNRREGDEDVSNMAVHSKWVRIG